MGMLNRIVFAALLASPLTAIAAGPDTKAEPASGKAPTAQQLRMTTCNQKATGMKGDERKSFMSSCLKGETPDTAAIKVTPQQQRMKDCNKEASEKKLKGDERKTFMSSCLKAH